MRLIIVDRIIDEREELYLGYRKMAFRIARNFHRIYPYIPYQCLEDKAMDCLTKTLCEKWDDYDPSKSLPSTWISHNVYWPVRNYCERTHGREKPLDPLLDAEEYPLLHQPSCVSWLESLRRELSEEGRALLRIICEAPLVLGDLVSSRAPVRSERVLKRHLRRLGWSRIQIQQAWNEIKECVI